MIKKILKYFGLTQVENLNAVTRALALSKINMKNRTAALTKLEEELANKTKELEKLILSKKTAVEYEKLKLFLANNNKLNKEFNSLNNSDNKVKLKAWSRRIKSIGSCDICDSKTNLSAHHLYDKSTHPSLCFQDENGVCLCTSCHNGFHRMYTSKSQTTPKMYDKYKIIKLNGLQ